MADAERVAGKAAPDLEVVPDLAAGSAAAVLREQSRGASMVVLGGRGAGGFAGLLAGSVALQVAEHAAAPVVVVRGRGPESGPVVAGVDASPLAGQALDFALREASLRGAELVAVHAWTNLAGAGFDDTLPAREESWAVADRAERMLAEALAGAAGRYPDVKINMVTRSRSACRWAAIVAPGSSG
ncbi:universal stress protein [Actinoplanes sp. NPDC049265]|uniref:universal stress protein n=1 Tax=Actinoplanes sp. NPDC049265 TaxID=3363902 RepID=UPI0037194619